MRVSENLKNLFLLHNLNRTMERMVKTENDLGTAKRIHKPSDDPGGTARLIRLKSYLSGYDRYEKNIEDGLHWVTATESAINNVMDATVQADAILMQAGNDTMGASERETLAGQLRELWEQVVQFANQKFGDKYLFGGTENDMAPYSLSDEVEDESFTAAWDVAVSLENVGLRSGSVEVTTTDGLVEFTEGVDYTIDYEKGTITVLGSGSMADGSDYLISYQTDEPSSAVVNPDGVDGQIFREVDEGVGLQINVSAEDMFEGTTGILSVLKQGYLVLQRNDREGIAQVRNSLQESLDGITGIQGEIGTKIQRLDVLKEKVATDQVNLESLISDIEDTDIAAAVVQLQKDQLVYQAALKAGADLIQTSLLDFLK